MSSLEAGDLFNVQGLVAVITGGGTGIGLMMAKALALNGASKVYIIGRRKEVIEKAARESPHGNIIPIVGDVTSKDILRSVAEKIRADVGYVNLFVANSGITGPSSLNITPESSLEDFQSTMWNMDFQEYTNVFAVNVSAVWFSIIAFLDLLDAGNKRKNVEQRSQALITSSIGGFNRKTLGGYAYGQSKAAATHLMKHLATNLVPYNIRANAIAPGCKFRPEILSFNSVNDHISVPFRNVSTGCQRQDFLQGCNTRGESWHGRGYGRRSPLSHEPSWGIL